MFYIQGFGIPGAVLGVGVLVERGFSGFSGLSGLSGLPSFTPGAQVGSAIFYTRGTCGSKPVTVASRQGLHIRGWIRSSVRSRGRVPLRVASLESEVTQRWIPARSPSFGAVI